MINKGISIHAKTVETKYNRLDCYDRELQRNRNTSCSVGWTQRVP